jgi:hypothetical protein
MIWKATLKNLGQLYILLFPLKIAEGINVRNVDFEEAKTLKIA